jgi:hypothetical protein
MAINKPRPKNSIHASHQINPIPKALQNIASNPGWVDQDIVKVRKLAKEGASTKDIAAAMGWGVPKTRSYMKRNFITPNKKRLVDDAPSIGDRKTAWRATAIRMWMEGEKIADIARHFGLTYISVFVTISNFRNGRGDKHRIG